jgi:hypothetical protein
MAGKKGQNKGNLNAAKHPHRIYLRRRVVPKQFQGVLRLGDECEAKIKADLPDMSGKESMVAEGVKILWTCAMLGLAEAKERGFVITKPDGGWDFQEGMKTAGVFIDRANKGMVALGLKRRAKLLSGSITERLAQIHGATDDDAG